MTNLLQDLRFALRQMRRSPGFAVTAVFTLALGIAANVIVFGVLQAYILRPLDVPRPEKLMTLARKNQTYPFFSYPEVRDVRDGNTVFSAVSAQMIQNFGLEANGVTRPVWGAEVGGQYFEAVSIKPFLGRLLQRADDDHPGASQAAVLSWPLWKTDFGADPNVVGKTVRIDKHPYTIVGVTPEGFYGTEKVGQLDILFPSRTKHHSTVRTGLSRGVSRMSIRSCASRTASPCPRCRLNWTRLLPALPASIRKRKKN
ncbi:MAG: ABC transporter permease [Terriglobales bacterium]